MTPRTQAAKRNLREGIKKMEKVMSPAAQVRRDFRLGRPAKPGDVIIAYGIGFGDVTPSILPGLVVGQSNTLASPVTISFGTAPATLSYSGLAGNFVGLYEFYITVPAGLANGDYQINVSQSGTTVPQTMYLSVHN